MSNVITILKAVKTHGICTLTDLEEKTGIPRNKLRWACNDLKATKRLIQCEDAITREIAYKITQLGIEHLEKSNSTAPAGGGQKTPAVAHRKPRVAGGTRQADPLSEGATEVIEAAKRDKTPAAPASDPSINWSSVCKTMEEEIDRLNAALIDRDQQIKTLSQQAAKATRGKNLHIDPCPFCGHDDIEINEVEPGSYAIDCPECRCIGPIKPDTMEAISYWNDRRGA